MATDPDDDMMRAFYAGELELVADRAMIERCAEIAARDLIASYRGRFGSSAPTIPADVPRGLIRPRARRELVAAIAPKRDVAGVRFERATS